MTKLRYAGWDPKERQFKRFAFDDNPPSRGFGSCTMAQVIAYASAAKEKWAARKIDKMKFDGPRLGADQ